MRAEHETVMGDSCGAAQFEANVISQQNQVLGSPKKKRKFKYKIGQSNVFTRYIRGINRDLSAWPPL